MSSILWALQVNLLSYIRAMVTPNRLRLHTLLPTKLGSGLHEEPNDYCHYCCDDGGDCCCDDGDHYYDEARSIHICRCFF